MSNVRKALIALVPLVGTLVAHFVGADSDGYFVWGTVVTALTALGVYGVPNKPA